MPARHAKRKQSHSPCRSNPIAADLSHKKSLVFDKVIVIDSQSITQEKREKRQGGSGFTSVFSGRAGYNFAVRRRLPTVAALLCGAAVTLTAFLWIRTQWTSYAAGYTTRADGSDRRTFVIEAGLLRFHLSHIRGECGWPKGWTVYHKPTTDEAASEFMKAQSRWQFAGFRGYTITAPKDLWPGPGAPVARCVDVPYWFVIVIGMVPALWLTAKGKPLAK